MNFTMRLLEINVNNIKNLKNGIVSFDSLNKVKNADFDFNSSDIIGIYGQNGSSKSALINAISIIKTIIKQDSLDKNIYNLIKNDENYLKISLSFYYEKLENKCIFIYNVIIKKDDNQNIYINSESLDVRYYQENKWTKTSNIITVLNDSQDLLDFISPKTFVKTLQKSDKAVLPKLLMLKGKKEESKSSLIFSTEFCDILNKANYYSIIQSFIQDASLYGYNCLHLYDATTLNDFFKDDVVLLVDNEKIITISLFKEGILDVKYETKLKNYLKRINIVLSKLIPNISIDYLNQGKAIGENNTDAFKYQFISINKNNRIPLSLESSGIKKIISLLSSFIDAFNNVSSILIIDEFDSGIFEYLQGLMLDVFKNKGLGQLLFTSHNLRALEVIKDNILFTSNDESNRFIRLPYKGGSNLRKQYLRDLYLGTYPNISIATDEYEIFRALNEAGDETNDETKQ